MNDTADWLVETLLPVGIAVRQWVLSVPFKMRYALARDNKLRCKVFGIFVREVERLVRKKAGGSRAAKGGAVISVQRFGSSLNLNVHGHTLVLEGVYEGTQFRPAAAPMARDLQELVKIVAKKIRTAIKKAGFDVDACEGEPEVIDQLQAASMQQLLAFPPAPGSVCRVKVLGEKEEVGGPGGKNGAAQFEGFSIHAGVVIGGNNRKGLGQLCRYVLRPPFSTERLKVDERGQVVYELRKRRFDGATHLVMSPVEFMGKLAALVPPPRAHLVLYRGVLAPNSRWRKQQSALKEAEQAKEGAGKKMEKRKRRRDWAELLQKTFAVDVLQCAKCRGRMKLIAIIRKKGVIQKILAAMGWDVEEMEAALVPKAKGGEARDEVGPDPPGEDDDPGQAFEDE
jgi:hypothetical protein